MLELMDALHFGEVQKHFIRELILHEEKELILHEEKAP